MQAFGNRFGRAHGHDKAISPIPDQVRRAHVRSDNDRQAAGKCFRHHQAKAFSKGWKHKNIRFCHEFQHLVVGKRFNPAPTAACGVKASIARSPPSHQSEIDHVFHPGDRIKQISDSFVLCEPAHKEHL